jgi:hypothetical protein
MKDQSRPPVSAEDVGVLVSVFGIHLEDARWAETAETLNAFLPLLETLGSVDVGDRRPAAEFRASLR